MVLDFILSFSFFFFFKISLHTSRFLPLLLVHIYIYVSMSLFYVFIYLYASIFTFLFLVYVRTFEIYISSYDLSTCVPPPLCSTCYIYQLTHITSPCLTLLVYCLIKMLSIVLPYCHCLFLSFVFAFIMFSMAF